jgi:predicted transport protein
MYIAFRRSKGFAGVVVLRSKLKVYLNIDISQLKDPFKKARDVQDIGHYSHGDTEVVIPERSEIPYTLSLIKQAYERN